MIKPFLREPIVGSNVHLRHHCKPKQYNRIRMGRKGVEFKPRAKKKKLLLNKNVFIIGTIQYSLFLLCTSAKI